MAQALGRGLFLMAANISSVVGGWMDLREEVGLRGVVSW
jgi:hypothetical protein